MVAPDLETVSVTVDGDRADADLAPGGENGAILIHGLASRRLALAPLARELGERGITTLSIDLRGHGTSQGPRGVLHRDRVMADLVAWKERLADEGAELSFLGGHSVGGLWSLYAAPTLEPDAVAAIASPASIRSEVGPIEEVGYHLAGAIDRAVRAAGADTLRVPYRVGVEDVLDHPRAIAAVEGLDLIQETIPAVNVDELLAIDGPAWARKVTVPTLVAHGCRDALIPRESTHQLFDALEGERTWMELPGPHDLFLDVEGQACAQRIADWVQGTLATG